MFDGLLLGLPLDREEVPVDRLTVFVDHLDVLDKPSAAEADRAWEERLVATVKLVARVKVVTHPRARLRSMARRPPEEPSGPAFTATSAGTRVVAIGVSTGGPAALVEILRALPADYPIPILVVIHLGKQFASAFADWLDGQSPIHVSYATDGERLAVPDRHLVLRDGRLRTTADPERHSCRPSVDVLFASLAAELGAQCAACLLTGMGKDGAEGLLAIRRAGGTTIAQDESTSVVFGMPREAIALGAAGSVLRLGEVAPALLALARRPPGRPLP